VQGLEAGEKVRVRLYRSPAEIERTIFAIGSHDMTLDLLAQFLAQRGRRLVSANVGSLGGLVALRRGEAHLAGSHLLDPATGEYNVAYIRQYLPDTPVTLVTWVGREQGLMVAPGNPKTIHSLLDLARPDVRFVNRQAGSGTRMLLDLMLKKAGINGAELRGYDSGELTHAAVAAYVASGMADTGMGVEAAAKRFDLGFVPLVTERYFFLASRETVKSPAMERVLETLRDPGFRGLINALPGYDAANSGQLLRVEEAFPEFGKLARQKPVRRGR
jgi:putative molybdopterin biosynthesis protein